MVKIIMHGCCGHMGQVISDLVAKDANAEIVAGIDVTDIVPKGKTVKVPKPVAEVLANAEAAKLAAEEYENGLAGE